MVISILYRNNNEKIVQAVIGYFNRIYNLLISAESWFYSPPSDTREKLKELADSTGRIIDQFNVSIVFTITERILISLPLLESPSDAISRPDLVYESDRWF